MGERGGGGGSRRGAGTPRGKSGSSGTSKKGLRCYQAGEEEVQGARRGRGPAKGLGKGQLRWTARSPLLFHAL